MKKNICVVTGTRAEYHLLTPVMNEIKNTEGLNLVLAVTGAHLSEDYGNTYIDIENDGYKIDVKVPILNDINDESNVNIAMAKAIIGFDVFFKENRPDMIVLLGDRYELMSVAIVAMNYRIPIAHIHGGETTEGAIDECIRHSISKMSMLHFTSCEEYRKRVIQLGENPNRVYNVGALGIENIKRYDRLTIKELEDSLNFDLNNHFAVVTFHPVTLEDNKAEQEFNELLEALDCFNDLKIIFTKSNADVGGRIINNMIDEYVKRNSDRCVTVFSLGMRRYLTALSYADIVIGNSSSGIIETPSFCVPTVNIGDRQKGRVQAKNILNCEPQKDEIIKTIEKGLSPGFRLYVKDTVSPYGDGNTSKKIVKIIKEYLSNEPDMKKSFYNIKESE